MELLVLVELPKPPLPKPAAPPVLLLLLRLDPFFARWRADGVGVRVVVLQMAWVRDATFIENPTVQGMWIVINNMNNMASMVGGDLNIIISNN